MDSKETWHGRTGSENECDIKNPFQSFSLKNYLKEEIWQHSRRRNEVNNSQEHVCGPFRNRVWKFLSIPQYFESFMFYGLLQCLDHLLMVYTFLPLRCIVTFTNFLSFIVSNFFRICISSLKPEKFMLLGTDARELVKFSFVCVCTVFLYTFDSSIAYHEIRTQSIIKIYIFFNLLEVADRLLSAVYLDAVDDVLFTVSAGLSGMRQEQPSSSVDRSNSNGAGSSSTVNTTTEVVGFGAFLVQYLFALVCLSAHCLLLLAQVTTLNVAFNSQNRSLLTVIISNNFVELKGNVFRKMGKSNLFQIACADVRERFHYIVWLFIIVCRNMSASGWQYVDFLALLPDILLILLAEVAVDWVKHAFISKFNVIGSDVYEEYTVSIAYDLLLCRQGKNTSDYFELLARRMGLTPISLSCLINVMIIQTVKSSWIYVFLLLALPLLFVLKVLVHIILLNRAYAHVHSYTQMMTSKMTKEAVAKTSTSPSPTSLVTVTTKTASTEVEVKRKSSIFYPPYSGYDQPTRDEGQLSMPLLYPRRSHSDSTNLTYTLISAGDFIATTTADEETDAPEDFHSIHSFSADTSTTLSQPRSILKSSQFEMETRFRQFLVDTDEMQIRHRKTIPTTTLVDSMNYTGLSLPQSVSGLFSSTPQHQSRFHLASSPNSSLICSPSHLPIRSGLPLRRCMSLNDITVLSSQSPISSCCLGGAGVMKTTAGDGVDKHVHFASQHRSCGSRRRRLHTENEVSSMLILEQLNFILNDETAHLEDAVDVDLLSDEEFGSTESKEAVIGNPLTAEAKTRIASLVPSSSTGDTLNGETLAVSPPVSEASVKQPLSNVDRYSMLGGQIS